MRELVSMENFEGRLLDPRSDVGSMGRREVLSSRDGCFQVLEGMTISAI